MNDVFEVFDVPDILLGLESHELLDLPPPEIVLEAFLVDVVIIELPFVEYACFPMKFSLYDILLEPFAEFKHILFPETNDAVIGVPLDLASLLHFMLYHVVLFAAAHESWEDIQRVVPVVKLRPKGSVYQIGLLVLQILLNYLSPYRSEAIKINLDFLFVKLLFLVAKVFKSCSILRDKTFLFA